MAAIEERDGVRFYVDRTSPLQPDPADPDARASAADVPAACDAALDGRDRRPARLARRHRGLREADAELAALAAARRRAGGGRCRPRACASGATFALIELAWARGGAARPRGADCADAPPARGPLLVHDRRAAGAARRARSASTRPPPATGPAATGSGSGRSSGGGWRRRRCCCRGARARWPRRRDAAAPTRSSCRCRSRRAARRGRARHRRGHLRREPARRRASTACWRRGAPRAAPDEELVVAGLDGAATERRALTGHARRATSTARCCAARACSSRRRGARTTGSPSSRRWPTAACWSPRRRRARTPRCRWRGRSTRAWCPTTSSARSASRSTTLRPATPSARRERAGAVAARGGRPRRGRAAAPAVTVARMTPVAGQSILITGAAHGIGAEVARRLAARGARVSLVGLGADELRRVAADCPGATVFDGDVTDQEALDAAVAGTVEALGGIDTVIANAGIAAPGFVRTMDPASFERVIEVNLLGVWRTVRACLPHVIERRGYVLPRRLGGGDPARCRDRRPTARRSPGVEAFGNALRVEVAGLRRRRAASPTSRGSIPRWCAAPTAPSSERPCARCSRARSPRPIRSATPPEAVVRGIEQPQPHRRLPALAAGADGAPPAAPVADRARDEARHRGVRPARRARGRRARLDPVRRRRAPARLAGRVAASLTRRRALAQRRELRPRARVGDLLRRQPRAPRGRDRRTAAGRGCAPSGRRSRPGSARRPRPPRGRGAR